MPSLLPSETSPEFRAELASTNLNRIRWFQVFCLGAAAAFFLHSAFDRNLWDTGILTHAAIDFLIILFMLAITLAVLKQPPSSPWRERNVWFATAVLMAGLQAWYFFSLPTFGQNPNYILGVITSGALVLLPPRIFWSMLVINHLVYCSLVFLLKLPSVVASAALSDGTLGVLIAALISRLLYRGKLADFQQKHLILAKNAELEELMVIAAHDLRSPLLGVRDMLNLGRRKLQDPAFLERMLQHTSQTCTELETLIARMIEAHSAEQQNKKREPVHTDLRPLIEASIDRLKPAAMAKKIELVWEAPEMPAVALLEPEVFGQALDNLLGNAVKYSPAGRKAGMKLFAEGRTWQVEVWDEGPGIPPGEETLLFKKFHRGSAEPTAGESSTGLGLFIVKTLIEAMNGRVSYYSRNPRGACFRLELPA